MMSDTPFAFPPIPLMTPEKARDTSRAYQALASHLTEVGYRLEAGRMERQAQWWMTYSIALAQTAKPERDEP